MSPCPAPPHAALYPLLSPWTISFSLRLFLVQKTSPRPFWAADEGNDGKGNISIRGIFKERKKIASGNFVFGFKRYSPWRLGLRI
jgi:hypothetical protein